MSEMIMLRGAEPRRILQSAIQQEVPATMSYVVKGRRHVAKVRLVDLGANTLSVEVSGDLVKDGRSKVSAPCAMDVQLASEGQNQQVKVCLKHGYGRFVFETRVVAFQRAPIMRKDCKVRPRNGAPTPVVVLAVPDSIKIAQRRSYFRVAVPESLEVSVQLWRHGESRSTERTALDTDGPCTFSRGKLVEISVGGAEIALDVGRGSHLAKRLQNGAPQGPDLKKGQVVELAFMPLPYEVPLKISAEIRNILSTADRKHVCLGLKFVELEASPGGRRILKRLCNVVERYYQINQSSAKQQDMLQTTIATQSLDPEPSSAASQS